MGKILDFPEKQHDDWNMMSEIALEVLNDKDVPSALHDKILSGLKKSVDSIKLNYSFDIDSNIFNGLPDKKTSEIKDSLNKTFDTISKSLRQNFAKVFHLLLDLHTKLALAEES